MAVKYAIQARGLTRAFDGFVAVDDVDLNVPAGIIYGYIGLNGAGKTTTIRMLTTLLAPSGGRARVLGRDVEEHPVAVRAMIGLVGEDVAATRRSWTPREYLRYHACLHGVHRPREHVEATLDLVDVDPAWRGRAIELHSTGMKRRLEIGRALLRRPPVLFLDEPTRGLDLPAKHATWDLLRRLSASGVTIFLSSHEIQEIQTLCTRLAVLNRGKIGYEGATEGLGSDAASFEAALLAHLKDSGDSKWSSPPRGW